MPNEVELTLDQKAARRRKARIFIGLFVLILGVPPLINSIDNPRLASLHGVDFVRLLASGWCFGIGFALLMSRVFFRGE